MKANRRTIICWRSKELPPEIQDTMFNVKTFSNFGAPSMFKCKIGAQFSHEYPFLYIDSLSYLLVHRSGVLKRSTHLHRLPNGGTPLLSNDAD